MSDFLETIKTTIQERVKTMPINRHQKKNTLDFCNIFKKENPVVIAEVKFASPSKGAIYSGTLNPTEIAAEYLSNGASALSVLTEPDYFKGDIQYLKAIRAFLPQSHLLLKDFVLSKVQISQALGAGANAVLLIVAFLEPDLLRELYEYSITLGHEFRT